MTCDEWDIPHDVSGTKSAFWKRVSLVSPDSTLLLDTDTQLLWIRTSNKCTFVFFPFIDAPGRDSHSTMPLKMTADKNPSSTLVVRRTRKRQMNVCHINNKASFTGNAAVWRCVTRLCNTEIGFLAKSISDVDSSSKTSRRKDSLCRINDHLQYSGA